MGLTWPKLIPGTLLKRYKRFLADVRLEKGETVTAHCPNTGSMKTCCEHGRPVYLSYHPHPKRKLKYTWQLIEMADSLVGINTGIPNRLVQKSIRDGRIEELSGYDDVISEVKTSSHSRIDLLLQKEGKKKCFVEIKNCTFVEEGVAAFPDAVTDRGLKHLVELQNLLSKGSRCVMFYLIQRMDAAVFKPADRIDPAYGRMLRQAVRNGVEIMAYDVSIDLKTIILNRKIPLMIKS